MHHFYLVKHEPDLLDSEKLEWILQKIITEDYIIGFGYPRGDTCETRDPLKVAVDSTEDEQKHIQLHRSCYSP